MRLPPEMIELGFDKHILPRFRFKHRIGIEPVTEGGDMALEPGPGAGPPLFTDTEAGEWRLTVALPSEATETFEEWLTSDTGRAAIEGFAPAGEAIFTTEVVAVEEIEEEVFDGDVREGSRLAIVHCGRCHVIDERNRWGGIGSTPSFAAMRGRENWSDLFRAFYAHNPHPSFTQVAEVTEPFGDGRQSHVAPVEITLDEIEAITAFVATLEAKRLGAPVSGN